MDNKNHSVDLAGLEERIRKLEDKTEITDLLNFYAETVDTASSNPDKWPIWETCFTEDCIVEFPFGRHEGREGLFVWGGEALAPFQATHHFFGNFQIELNGDDAKGRTNLLATHIFEKDKPDKYFTLGGFYEWVFRRTTEGWKIKTLKLTMVWTEGEDTAELS